MFITQEAVMVINLQRLFERCREKKTNLKTHSISCRDGWEDQYQSQVCTLIVRLLQVQSNEEFFSLCALTCTCSRLYLEAECSPRYSSDPWPSEVQARHARHNMQRIHPRATALKRAAKWVVTRGQSCTGTDPRMSRVRDPETSLWYTAHKPVGS